VPATTNRRTLRRWPMAGRGACHDVAALGTRVHGCRRRTQAGAPVFQGLESTTCRHRLLASHGLPAVMPSRSAQARRSLCFTELLSSWNATLAQKKGAVGGGCRVPLVRSPLPDDFFLRLSIELHRLYRYLMNGGISACNLLSRDKEKGMYPHTATCAVASDPTSLSRWASALSRDPRLRIMSLCSGGLQCCHVSLSSGPRLSVRERAPALPHVHRLPILPPCSEGSGATTCPAPLRGARASKGREL
jgi:hypothetical protein